MNEILRTKYKIHRFINLAYYFIFFIVGFLIGGGKIEKISYFFNNIFN